MSERNEKYTDKQKIQFGKEEAYAQTIQGRKNEPITSIGDYMFGIYPKSYIVVCNKFFGGSVKAINN